MERLILLAAIVVATLFVVNFLTKRQIRQLEESLDALSRKERDARLLQLTDELRQRERTALKQLLVWLGVTVLVPVLILVWLLPALGLPQEETKNWALYVLFALLGGLFVSPYFVYRLRLQRTLKRYIQRRQES